MNEKIVELPNFITEILPKDEKIIVAVSGGLDSVSLLHILHTLKYNLVCVHFNHGVRKASDSEEKFVRDLAKKYKIPFYSYKVIISTKENFQSAARNFRYEKLKEVAKINKTKYITTAHHLDDLLETIILKLIRGSNLFGYSGMALESSGDDFIYLRPLLHTSKDEIKKYAKKYNIEYKTDLSNYEIDYLRNKIRLCIIPLLKQEQVNILQKARDYSEQLQSAYNFIRKESKSFLGNKSKINIKDFLKQDDAIQNEVIALLLNKYNLNTSFNIISDIKKVIKSKKPNLEYLLSSNYKLVKDYETFTIGKATKKKNDNTFIVEETKTLKDQIISYSNHDLSFQMPMGKITYETEMITFPLIARKRKPGDELDFHYGTKKLNRFFIDKKVPVEKRNDSWVVTDSRDVILWIPDLYLNQTLKGSENLFLKYNRNIDIKIKEKEDK